MFLMVGTNNASPGPSGLSNNVVDTNGFVGAAIYDHSNSFHTTYIEPNVALTIGGSPQVYNSAPS